MPVPVIAKIPSAEILPRSEVQSVELAEAMNVLMEADKKSVASTSSMARSK